MLTPEEENSNGWSVQFLKEFLTKLHRVCSSYCATIASKLRAANALYMRVERYSFVVLLPNSIVDAGGIKTFLKAAG